MAYDDLTIDELAQHIATVESTLATQRGLLDNLKGELMSRMEAQGLSSTLTEDGRRVTIVRSQTTKWDEEILKDILAPLGLWERVRILREDIDEAALERMVDRGELDLDRLRPALTVSERKPYPKITGGS